MTAAKKIENRIESKLEVETYIARLKYALKSGTARIIYLDKRQVDTRRQKKYTNKYTIDNLFPGQEPVKILNKELLKLKCED